MDVVREEREGAVIVTFNRPQKLNAVNLEMRAVLTGAVDDLRDRSDLRLLLIKSTGPYFTAGIDISGQRVDQPPDVNRSSFVDYRRDYRRPLHLLFDEMEEIEKPVVVAIQGVCLGVGVEMSGSADFRLASANARFGLPEIDIGVIAGSGGTSRFTRLCGIGWSKWLNMAGEQIDAQTAMIAGFVQAIYPAETFEDEVWAFCKRVMSRPADVQGASKTAIELSYDLDRNSARRVERLTNTSLVLRDRRPLIEKVMDRSKRNKT
ncbi:MAG: enoyl-CoA hydratase/isomerase family protein [Caulobacteraceae bacterium]|nr:enoyl-CoA hydratase/isomerase family protein [Caulobacteraceae bacterium]